MEEVWKDINLTSLNDHDHSSSADHHHLSLAPNKLHPPPPPHHHHHSNPNFILQDFFSGCSPHRDPPSRICSGHRVQTNTATALFQPPTILSLNSIRPGPGFDFLDNSSEDLIRNNSNSPHFNNHHSNTSVICSSDNFITPFDGLDSSPTPCNLHSFGKKRIQDSDHNTSSCDRRHKRMIKNRESAARSRARKQAYTQELENAVNQLTEENARLKKEHQKLYMAAASQLPKKHTLYRTSTAPF